MGDRHDMPPRSPLRVLVADDNVDVRESMRLLLEVAGYEVHVARDGRAALAAAELLAPHVCILDVGMPLLTGDELARLLRRAFGKSCPYLIGLSGQSYRSPQEKEAVTTGFDRFVTKPADASALLSLLRDLAARRSSVRR
jgi:CheY-like chemotaxis protein